VPEPIRTLREKLRELERQLEGTELDPALRAELQERLREVRDRCDAGTRAEDSLLEGIRDLTLRFEAAHPALSEAVGAVASALAQIGI
jgi:Domain of unknown function (DUF4404)